jgi:hypothetical protein
MPIQNERGSRLNFRAGCTIAFGRRSRQREESLRLETMIYG